MGMTSVQLLVKNPRKPQNTYQDEFLIDSGATYTSVPEQELRNLGIEPQREETFSLADGSSIQREIGNALFEYKGIEAAAPVLFGEEGDSLLLGTFTLEALGLTLDPIKRELRKAKLRM